jgi:hypothetical protein
VPRRGRHDAMEYDPNEAATRAFRYRRLAGGRPQTVTLRGQIARFLHSHKGEEMPTDGISKPNMDERNA